MTRGEELWIVDDVLHDYDEEVVRVILGLSRR